MKPPALPMWVPPFVSSCEYSVLGVYLVDGSFPAAVVGWIPTSRPPTRPRDACTGPGCACPPPFTSYSKEGTGPQSVGQVPMFYSVSKPSLVVMADRDARLASKPPTVPRIWVRHAIRRPPAGVHILEFTRPRNLAARSFGREVTGMRERDTHGLLPLPRYLRVALGFTETCLNWPRFNIHSPPIPPAIYHGRTPLNSQISPSRSRPSPCSRSWTYQRWSCSTCSLFQRHPGVSGFVEPTVHLTIFSTRNRHLDPLYRRLWSSLTGTTPKPHDCGYGHRSWSSPKPGLPERAPSLVDPDSKMR
jgi:hypothetical protein